MSTIHFNDGMSFDTSGPLRIVRKSDGLYVVGKGMLIPIDNREEGQEIINQEKAQADLNLKRENAKVEGILCVACGHDLKHQTRCPGCGVFVGGHEG